MLRRWNPLRVIDFPRPPEVGRGGVFSGDHSGLAEPCPAHRSSPHSRSVSMVTARAEWAGRGKTAFRGGACGGSGIRGLRGAQVPEMLRAGWLRLCAALCSLLLGRAEAPSPGVPPEQSRPYAVLRGQNLGERRGAARGARLQPDPGAGSLCGARAARGWGSGPALGRWSSRSCFSCCQPQAWEPALAPCVLAAPAGTGSWRPGFVRSCLLLCGLRRGSRAHPESLVLFNGPVRSDGVCN